MRVTVIHPEKRVVVKFRAADLWVPSSSLRARTKKSKGDDTQAKFNAGSKGFYVTLANNKLDFRSQIDMHPQLVEAAFQSECFRRNSKKETQHEYQDSHSLHIHALERCGVPQCPCQRS
jgi:hypothetical protein